MALSDINIFKGIENGEIFIHPYNEEDVGSASVDVRLGINYFEAQNIIHNPDEPVFYNIYSAADVHKVWGEKKRGIPATVYKRMYPHADWSKIWDDDMIIMLAPHANLLCHTQEFIGAKINSTTMMKARSSIGRSLINVCQCAGMGDVGFFNLWVMEIYNRDNYYIPLVVGRRCAQIVFLETGPTKKTYISKYQSTDVVDELIKNWKPEDMLPRLDIDRDIQRRYVDVVY